MSDHDHQKKHHHHDDTHKKKHHGGHHHDEGKLHHATKHKHMSGGDLSGDDAGSDMMTPGLQGVPATAPKNLEADVVAAMNDSANPGMCLVTVNRGADDGIVDSMDAYLLASDHTHYSFRIKEVRPGATVGWIDGSESFVQHQTTMRVVLNPA
jgi:hypothetical protein